MPLTIKNADPRTMDPHDRADVLTLARDLVRIDAERARDGDRENAKRFRRAAKTLNLLADAWRVQ